MVVDTIGLNDKNFFDRYRSLSKNLYAMLQRSLLYIGVTRGKRLPVLVGTP